MENSSINETARRHHGFDALRALAMLLGIVLHAGVTWMTARSTYVVWVLDRESGKPAFDVLVWWIHGWRIPVFFVMAGFFGAMLMARRGVGGFVQHRMKRLVLPLLIATITILPVVYTVWIWGLASEGRVAFEWGRLTLIDPELDLAAGDPAHLWFLWDLVLFSALFAGLSKLRPFRAGPVPSFVRRAVTGIGRPVLFAAPAVLFFLLIPELRSFDSHGLVLPPGGLPAKLGQLGRNGWFFGAGVLLYWVRDSLPILTRGTWTYLISAQIIFGATWPALHRTIVNGGIPLSRRDYLVVAFGLNLFCWLMIFGLVGVALRYFDVDRSWQRWMSDSAYWVYLVHLPMVGALAILFRHWPVPPEFKFLAIIVIVSAVTLLSYRYLVRYTAIGRLLNGPRKRTTDSTSRAIST